MAYSNDHIMAKKRAFEVSAKAQGFFYWSLLDSYEWAEGYEKRFGMVHVNFETLKRTPIATYHARAQALKG